MKRVSIKNLINRTTVVLSIIVALDIAILLFDKALSSAVNVIVSVIAIIINIVFNYLKQVGKMNKVLGSLMVAVLIVDLIGYGAYISLG